MKNRIMKGISWFLVMVMLITGMASGISFPVEASGNVTQSVTEADVSVNMANISENAANTSESQSNTAEIPADTTEAKKAVSDKKTDISEDKQGTADEKNNTSEAEDEEELESDLAIVFVKSPVVDAKNRSITFNLNAATGTYSTAKEVFLRGDVIDDWNVGLAMTKKNNVFTVTVNDVNPGVYTYKYVVDGTWITDPHNTKTISTSDGANSAVYMPGLSSPNGAVSVMKGIEKSLPDTLKYYDEAGNFTNVSVTYSLPEEYQDAAILNGNRITVNKEIGETIEVIAAYQSDDATDTARVKVSVVESVYTYNIYYYDFESSRMATDASQLWMWEPDVSNGVAYDFSKTADIDGSTWLKGSVELSCKDVAIIVRSFGGWKWQNSSKGMVYNNADGKGEVDLYIVSGSKTIYTEAPDLESLKPRERYMVIEYERENKDYTGWNVYTWNSGYDERIDLEDLGGKKVAKIKIKDSVADMTLGFILRRSDSTSEWLEKDGGDNYLTMPANQTILKAQFVQGKGVVTTTPDNIGYEMDGADKTVHFYYRDDDKYLNYDMESLKDKVSVWINGTEYPMEYNSDDERFCYDVTGVEADKLFQYYYIVDGKKVLDKFNETLGTTSTGEQCNECTYHDFKLDLSASLSLSEMDYNQNNVLTLKTKFEEGQDTDAFAAKSICCDLSALGGSNEFSIDSELMEGTISVKDTVEAGVYTVPVELTDIYGNIYKTEVKVKVKEREKKAGDFDWDEAVVYFAVTDRFFDGDASNNDAYGVGDYNTSTATTKDGGGSSYHGGDFAGLTQKLDYLKDLGVNTIWITPIVENITQDLGSDEGLSAYGYHGYWASDFTTLNKHLGTEEQFKTLLEAAHSKGMKIMVDVVINHAGYDTEDYFNSIISDGNGGYINMVRDDSTTIDGDTVRDGLSGLPDFVTENPQVRDQLVKWQVDWVEKYDIDYYRVDTVKHVESTTWKAFKNELTKVNPEFKMIGEYAGGGYAATGGELGTGSMDALLDFDFNDLAQRFITGDIESVENILTDRNSKIDNTATLGSFLGSHDEVGFITRLCSKDDETGAGLSEEVARKLYKIAVSLQLTAKGMPVIYYNEIIGASGEENYPYQTNRADFDWNEAETQTYEADSVFNHYKTLISIRNRYTSVFAKGNRVIVSASDEKGYSLVSRSYNGETVYVGLNIADADQTVEFTADAGTVYRDLYNNKTYTADAEGKIALVIPAAAKCGTAILAKAVAAESITADTATATLDKGESAQLKVTVIPADTTTNVSWMSSDEKVAVVSKSGVVKGISAGKAKVTALLGDDSGKKVEFTIIVKAKGDGDDKITEQETTENKTTQTTTEKNESEIKVSEISISGPSKKLAAGKKVKLTAKVTPSNAANQKIVWSSSNTKYATVDSMGKVTLKKAGGGKSVTITATAEDGSNVKASYKIKIMKHAVKSIKLKASSKSVKAGKTLKLKATIKTSGKSANKTLKWTSSNTKYATVNNKGVVTAKKAGKGKKVTITARATDGSNKKATIKIKIKK